MQTIVLLATLVAAALAIPSAETYDAKFDNMNSQEIAETDRLLGSLGKCFIGEVPCTKEAAELKVMIPDALKTNCAKCTPKQRHHIRVVTRAMQKKKPDVWAKVEKQYDPKGIYKKSFEDLLNSDD